MRFSLSATATGLWLCAFFFSFAWYTPFENEFFAGTLICLFLALALNDSAGIVKREWKYPTSPILISAGLFWLVALASLAASKIIFVAWIYFFFLSLLPFSLLFFLVGDNFETRLERAWTGIKFILSGLSVYAICQYFFLPNYLFQGRVQEPMADANSLAAVLSLGIFMLAGRIMQSQRINRIDAACLFLTLAGFFTTGSRGAFLVMAITGAAFIFSVGPRRINRNVWWTLGGIGLAALIIIGVIYTPTFYSGPLKVFNYSIGQKFENVMAERAMIWNTAIQMISAHPFLGTGPGTFSLYYGEVKNISDTTAGYSVHNDPLQFAAEMGIFSTVIFYLICIQMCARTCKAVRKLSVEDQKRYEVLTPFFALTALVLHAHITADFHVMPCLMLAAFVFAVWYCATARALNENFRMITAPDWMTANSLKALFPLMAFFMILLIAAPLWSQRLALMAQKDLEAGRLAAFAKKADLANLLSAGTNASILILAAEIPLAIVETDHNIKAGDKTAFLQQSHSLLTRAENMNERNANIFWLKARLAKIEHAPELEKQNLEKAVRINPAQMSARMALADALENEGRSDQAYAVMQAGIDVKYAPKDAERYFEYYLRTEHMKDGLAQRAKSGTRKVP